MGPAPIRYGAGGVPLSAQRARVLEHLQQSVPSTTVGELASLLGLHTNTVREHLDALVERGLATRRVLPAVGRGRPAGSYAAVAAHPEPDPRVRDYAGLASALAGQIARTSTDPRGDAIAAGEGWGRRLSTDLPFGSPAQARRNVVALLGDLGFAPDADARGGTVRLLRCPLLDAARAHPDVVCPVHLGIVRGVLAALGGDPQRATLLPFSEPGACRLELNTPVPAVQR
jgi:predicted ArsR family transcriptional regulator